MSSQLLDADPSSPPPLTPFEGAFLRAVLEHRGIFQNPSDADIDAAAAVLRRYDEQCRDSPGGSEWEPRLRDEERQAELRAKAFMMFGATKPTPAQWLQAYNALFGPLLGEAFG